MYIGANFRQNTTIPCMGVSLKCLRIKELYFFVIEEFNIACNGAL